MIRQGTGQQGECIETTPEHPFYVGSGTWIAAVELWLVAEIVQADGTTGTVEALEGDDFIITPLGRWLLAGDGMISPFYDAHAVATVDRALQVRLPLLGHTA